MHLFFKFISLFLFFIIYSLFFLHKRFFSFSLFLLLFFFSADNYHRISGKKISLFGKLININKILQTLKYQSDDFYIGIDRLNFIIRNSFNLTTTENIILIINQIYLIPKIKISKSQFYMKEDSVLLLSNISFAEHSEEHSSESSRIPFVKESIPRKYFYCIHFLFLFYFYFYFYFFFYLFFLFFFFIYFF